MNTFLTPCKERAIPRGAFTRVSRFLRTTSAELTHHPLLSGEEELFRSAKRETVKWFSTPFIALSSPMSALQRLKRLHAQQKELQEGKEPNPKEQPLFHLKITHKVPPKNSFKVCHKSE